MSVHVTERAIDCYIERIAPVGRDRARAIIEGAGRTIEIAAKFGSHIVRLGTGGKLIVRGSGRISVVSVIGRNSIAEHDELQLTSPVCCGLCGLRCNHPIARACTRTACSLGAQRRTANDGGAHGR